MTALLPATEAAIKQAVSLLKANEVVALPTETVYGLAGNAHQTTAAKKIFLAKDRPESDPLIVHVSESHLTHAAGLLQSLALEGTLAPEVLTWAHRSQIELLLRRYWPGPLTVILPRGPKIPDIVTHGLRGVGLRCPAHAVFQAVLAKLSFPLAAPSANRFGKISPTRAQHVDQELRDRIPLIIDGGPCLVGVESTILKIEDQPFRASILRPGKISADEISKLLQIKVEQVASSSKPSETVEAPGQLEEHYSPNKTLFLYSKPFSNAVASMIQWPQNFDSKRMGVLSMGALNESYWRAWNPQKVIELTHREPSGEMGLQEISQRLFHALRELDQDPHVEWILADVPRLEDDQSAKLGLAAAVRDRLNRASKNKPLL
jgi:L-threonylcarbamoyladenylate synthase